jgi:outer membrane immunogenic protein
MSPGGFTGGGQGGFNWQTGPLVLGLETDYEYLGQKGTRSVGPITYPCCAPTAYSIKQKLKTDNLFTLRPRVGWAANNFLFYVTSGLALSEVNTSFKFSDTFASARASGSRTLLRPGWTAGGGVEYGITPNWTVRGEYLYASLNTIEAENSNLSAFTPPITFPANKFTQKGDLASNIMRVAVNFKF